jgi:DNA adenine methylase
MEPLLKWPGGKRLLIDQLRKRLPSTWNQYFEPFVGGGALFFALQPTAATLSDLNPNLIETYLAVRNCPQKVIAALKQLRNGKREYYRVRNSIPSTPIDRAARFIYLCTLAFNGIHRCNLKGEFNVPYGFKKHLAVCDEDRIRNASTLLQNASLCSSDFEDVISKARAKDLIYFDPPYTVAHNNNGFIKYNAPIFSWADQIRLAEVAKRARDKGCSVLVSNADHDTVRELYPDFSVATITRHSIIASQRKFRRPITECLFWHTHD